MCQGSWNKLCECSVAADKAAFTPWWRLLIALCRTVLSTLLKGAFALVFSFFTNLSKEDWCNPKGEVTVVLQTPGSLQVFDGKACFGLFYIKVTNPAFKEK